MTDTTNENANPSNVEENAADLTLQDLSAIKSIIDVASSRGAFKPNEMVAVGTIYSKLDKFLELAQKQSQAAQTATPTPTQG